MTLKRTIAQLLRHLQAAGVTHVPRVELPKPSPAAKAAPAGKAAPATGRPAAATPARPTTVAAAKSKVATATQVGEPKRSSTSVMSAQEIQADSGRPEMLPEVKLMMSQSLTTHQARTDALCALAKSVAACKRCDELATRRKQTVFGVGNASAKIMFIGEAPGAEEDAQGEPFVGPAGQLLDKIIVASTLKREDLYICNILRCRPPGNRNPLPQEASNCREYLDAQIHVVQPKYIVCWGTVAAQNLLNVTEAVGKLRGRMFDYNGIQVMCTYHPSYLLRNPAAKKQVWDDMKFFMKHLGVELQ